jgi:hypothetical protein
MLAHRELESVEVVVLGLEGMGLHASTGAETEDEILGCDHHSVPAGELGSRGGGRTTSTIRGGGGSRGRNRPMILFLTSSLFPHSNSPIPSSSSPSRAET